MKIFYKGYRFLESKVDVFNPTLVMNFFQNLTVDPEMMYIVEKYQNYSLAGGIPTENHIKIMSDVNSKVSLRLIQALLNNSEIAYEIIEKFMFDGDLDNSKWVVKEAINYGEKKIFKIPSQFFIFMVQLLLTLQKNHEIHLTMSDQSSKFPICLPKSTSFKLFMKFWKKIRI